MPAAAVIPAPVAYIKIVAVKKLVVGFLARRPSPHASVCECWYDLPSFQRAVSTIYLAARVRSGSFTLKKLECLKQAYALNTLAWNNNIGLRPYFVGF